MSNTSEKQSYYESFNESDSNTIKQLIDQDVDCNLLNFNPDAASFISPIRLVAEKMQYNILRLLYEYRNRPTKAQLEKHLQLYINHYDPLQKEKNRICFDYIVSRFLYTRITIQCKSTIFNTLIVALHDFDYAKLREQDLCAGSTHGIFLQLRIYTLFQMIIDEIIKPDYDNNELNILKDELLQNLETYYFFDSIFQIPGVTQAMLTKRFIEIESLLKEYYEPIAKNLIEKIKKLERDQEYTIPTGWIGHAVCVSFQCINKPYVRIRIDNSSHKNPKGEHEVRSTVNSIQIRPKLLGQLNKSDLDKNLEYFILLIDSVRRDLSLEEGYNLIYNRENKIVGLITEQTKDVATDGSKKSMRYNNLSCFSWCRGKTKNESWHEIGNRYITELPDPSQDIPFFNVQAQANCFVKCYEPGCWIRFGRKHNILYKQIVLDQKNNANRLVKLWEEEYGHSSKEFFNQFKSLNINWNINDLCITYMKPLQDKLKRSYQQNLQFMWSYMFGKSHDQLKEKYIPLRLKKDDEIIELENIFIKPRILLVADAGCGKTTLCQYATYLWATGELWKNTFDWLFYIKMININSKYYPPQSNRYSLIDIIEQECFSESSLNYMDKQKLQNNLANSTNILWILDGCDEPTMPDYLSSIKRELFSKSNILLASRPYQTDELECNVRIKIQPFNDDDIEKYITKYFPTTNGATDSTTITTTTTTTTRDTQFKQSGHLKEIAQFPACLEILCSLGIHDREIFEKSMTVGEIYQKMCEHLLRRYLSNFHNQSTQYEAGKEIYQLPNAIPFTHLEFLAFKASAKHEFKVDGKELIGIADSTSHSVLQIGLLKSENQGERSESPALLEYRNARVRDSSFFLVEENTYHFVHPSFQEYLCARYMINTLSLIYSRELEEELIQFKTEQENKLTQFIAQRKEQEQASQYLRIQDGEIFQFMNEREEEMFQFMDERERKIIQLMGQRGKERIQLLKKGKKEVIQFISDEKYNRDLQHIFQLFFELNPSKECMNQFWLAVDGNPRDLVGIRHCSRIIRWIRDQVCGSPAAEHITQRTIDIVQKWMFNKDRKAHDYGNDYIFDWFDDLIPKEQWLNAWKEDLSIDPLKRRYFLPDLWSMDNIEALKNNYENIPKDNLRRLYTLIKEGPTERNLKLLNLDRTSFTLHNVNDQNETSAFLVEAQRKARERESITDKEEFRKILTNYDDFANLNRRTAASGKEIWPLKIASSLLRYIDHETSERLLELTEKYTHFYRNFKLPIIPVLELYAQETTSSQINDIPLKLIVSIAFSSEYLLTAPLGTEYTIQVHKIREDDEFTKIKLDKNRWDLLVKKFDEIRENYGYSPFSLTVN